MAEQKSKFFDRRTVDRYIEKGTVKDADFRDRLKSLPDDSANAQWVQMDLHDAEISDDDLDDSDMDDDAGLESEPEEAH